MGYNKGRSSGPRDNEYREYRDEDHMQKGRKPAFKRGPRTTGGRDNQSNWQSTFDVVCSECGANCKVPFKPTGNKPVLCDNCFRGQGSQRSNSRPQRSDSRRESRDLDEINKKLDLILEAMGLD